MAILGDAGWRAASVTRRILAASVGLGLANIAARLALAARELTVAFFLGTTPRLGAFLMAALLPTYLAQVISSALPTVFVPAYVQFRSAAGAGAAARLLGGVTILVVGLLSGMTALVLILFPLFLDLVAPRFASADRELATELVWILAPYATLRGLGALWGATLNAERKFMLPALTPALTPLVGICALLLFRRTAVEALAWAMVFGMAGEGVITAMAVRSRGIEIRPRLPAYLTDLRRFGRQFLPMIAASAILATTVIVDQTVAALISPTAVSLLYYSNLFVLFPVTLAGTALATAALPYVSEMTAERRWHELWKMVVGFVRSTALFTVPLTLALLVFAPAVVSAVFSRGAFTETDALDVAAVVRCLSIMIPLYLAAVMAIQTLSALRRTDLLLWASLAGFTVKVVLNYLLVLIMGLPGIGLSTTICYASTTTIALAACHRELRARMHD